jgi:hypothetical protein
MTAGSSTELPEKNETGDVGVTAGRSEAEEAVGLDTHQGAAPLFRSPRAHPPGS